MSSKQFFTHRAFNKVFTHSAALVFDTVSFLVLCVINTLFFLRFLCFPYNFSLFVSFLVISSLSFYLGGSLMISLHAIYLSHIVCDCGWLFDLLFFFVDLACALCQISRRHRLKIETQRIDWNISYFGVNWPSTQCTIDRQTVSFLFLLKSWKLATTHNSGICLDFAPCI